MQQIVLKENIPHPNHNKDEGDGDGYQNHGTMYNKQRTCKIIITWLTIYPNHTNINFLYKTSWTRGSPQGGAGDGTLQAIDGGYDGDLEGTK